MKTFKYIIGAFLLITIIYACTNDDFGSTSFVETAKVPENVAAQFTVTQDNTGLVTITPTGIGASWFDIDFGDNSETEKVISGENTTHTYAEGTYNITITAYNTTGLKTTATQELVVSFNAPENLEVVIENDAAISRQVNVTATANYAISYDVYFGESDNETPITVNIGESTSYQYQEAGTYTITVVAMGAAIETTTYTEEFEVTAISQPLEAAPVPINAQADVISIYSDSYNNPDPIDYNPNWGQTTAYNEIDIAGNNTIQYSELTYQGIDFHTAAIDASSMEFIHVDVWTSSADFDAKLSPISSGPNETAYDLELVADQWTSFDIPISFFTEANPDLDFSDIIQFKFDGVPSGEGTIFIDNLYFYKTPSQVQTGIVGTWKIASTAGALGVGPALGDISWWNCDDTCVSDRACYYDDKYVFNEDGSFQIDFGSETWVEAWQGGGDSCGAPVAPHDGSNPATYVYNESTKDLTLNGVGAFIGIAKAYNGGELSSPADAPSSITYNATFIDPNTLSVYIETSSGVFWQYTLVRDGVVTSPLTGSWKLSPEAGSLGVGPNVGDISWWNCDATCVGDRACYYDDTYVFGADGSFTNVLGSQTWVETWQGGGDSCGSPVAPHDGSNPATYTYSNGVLTLNGTGAYIGIPKAVNTGELASPADAPPSVTYQVSFLDNNTVSIYIESGTGVFWQYKLVRI